VSYSIAESAEEAV